MMSTVELDVWKWITDFIEVENEFYDFKFAPCPYAKAARLQGLVNVVAYDNQGSAADFLEQQTNMLLESNCYHVQVHAFPYYYRWHYKLHRYIQRMNQTLVPQDYYAQYGKAVNTHSLYPGMFKGFPYFVCIVNKLSVVLSGSDKLKKTDYYQHWTKTHYNNVVTRRYNMFKEYS